MAFCIPRTITLPFLAFTALVLVLAGIAPANADVCRRQNLVGNWVNNDPSPDAGDLTRVEISYDCDRDRFSMRAAYVRADGHEVWFVRNRAELIGDQPEDRITKIGGNWQPANPCGGTNPLRLSFWHVITTWQTTGLRVVYRGRTCGENRTVLRQYTFQRG